MSIKKEVEPLKLALRMLTKDFTNLSQRLAGVEREQVEQMKRSVSQADLVQRHEAAAQLAGSIFDGISAYLQSYEESVQQLERKLADAEEKIRALQLKTGLRKPNEGAK